MAPEVLQIPQGNEMFEGYRAAFEKYGFSPAVKSRGFLFISGQVGARPDGSAPEDVAGQSEWALKRIKELLRIAGLDLSDLVDVTSYHVDIEETLSDFMEVKQRFIKSPFPAWSIGAWLGGATIAAGLGLASPNWAGALLSLSSLGLAIIAWATNERGYGVAVVE